MIIAAFGTWYGGWVDEVIQRITEVNLVLPFLSILIMVGTFYSRSLWVILACVIALSIFGGAIKGFRAIFLQIKEAPYVEAARAYGASNMRIVMQYLVPRIIPLLIPQLVIPVSYTHLDAALEYATSYGLNFGLLYNPVATFTDGRINPFGNAKIREAMNMLLDRDYIIQEIFGGLGAAKYSTPVSYTHLNLPTCEPIFSNRTLFVSNVASIVPVSSQVLIFCVRTFAPPSIIMEMASVMKYSFLSITPRFIWSSMAANTCSELLK